MEMIKVYLVYKDLGHGDKSLLIVTRDVNVVTNTVRENYDNDEYVYNPMADDPPHISIEEYWV
jgi:hypothetical protein